MTSLAKGAALSLKDGESINMLSATRSALPKFMLHNLDRQNPPTFPQPRRLLFKIRDQHRF
jgi:hypothetical protein